MKTKVYSVLLIMLCSFAATLSLSGCTDEDKAESWEQAEFSQAAASEKDEKSGTYAEVKIFSFYGEVVPAEQLQLSEKLYYLSRIENADGYFTGKTGLYQYDMETEETTLLCKVDDAGGIYRDLVACEAGVYWLREKNPRGSLTEELGIMKYDLKDRTVKEIRTFTDAWRDMAFGYQNHKIYRFTDVEHGPSRLLVYDEKTGEETVCMEDVYGGSMDFIQINDGMVGIVTEDHRLLRYQAWDDTVLDEVELDDSLAPVKVVANERYAAFLTGLSGGWLQIAVYDYEKEAGFLVAGFSEKMGPAMQGLFDLQGEMLLYETEEGTFCALDLSDRTYWQVSCSDFIQ